MFQSQNKVFKYLLLFLLVLLLVGVRAFEDKLFYDPFISYFKAEFYNVHYPKYDAFRLFFSFTVRYLFNSIVSLGIIYVLFKDFSAIKFSALLLFTFYIILILAMCSLLYFFDEKQSMALFYVRRFIIQPIFLLLFIPAFYYQKRNS